MSAELRANLSTRIDAKIVERLLDSYSKLVAANRVGQATDCLREAGLFVEIVLIALEFIRSGKVLAEVKNVSDLVRQLGSDKSLGDQFRVIIPRFAQAMYEVRSKRGAVHEKEIDPKKIDAAVCANCASWIMAELVRNFHKDDERTVAEAMVGLMNVQLPMLETLGGETIVTAKVPVPVELLLLVGQEGGNATRRSLGLASKYPPQRVSEALKKLQNDRLIHQSANGSFHLTDPGRRFLSLELARQGLIAA